MHEIVAARVRYGYRRVHIMLKREGWRLGRNVVYRLYREEGLALRTKRPRRRKMAAHRAERQMPSRVNEAWSLDFVHDQMASGRRFRVLNVVDDVTRECLAAVPDTSISGHRVVRELTRLISERGKLTR